MLKIYNVLTRKLEEFRSIEPNKVRMYACGITASGNAHVGHAYQAIIFDVIRNYLEFVGYDVTYVRNYTDVDDKIILNARKLGVNPTVFANEKMAKIDNELNALGVKKPTIQSKATDCIQDMIRFIQGLIDKGYAYATEYGDVFFKVSAFKNYGALSNRVTDDGLIGVRKSVEPGKLDDRDFALWKNAKDDEIFWQSPWGYGRPGWHIECSTMSMKYLGETIDIHGGGRDLIFPHHENEIAQSESLTGKKFANYWVHNGLIKINDQKMSKSLNNGILLEDLLNNYNFEVIRLLMLANKYSSDLNIIDGMFDVCEKKIYHFYKVLKMCKPLLQVYQPNVESAEYVNIVNQFKHAMDNDFNTAVAVANLYSWIDELEHNINKDNQKAVNMYSVLVNVYKILNLLQQNPYDVINQIVDKHLKLNQITKQEIDELINQRTQYKLAKNYQLADGVRNSLADKHINIMDKNINGVATTLWDIDI